MDPNNTQPQPQAQPAKEFNPFATPIGDFSGVRGVTIHNTSGNIKQYNADAEASAKAAEDAQPGFMNTLKNLPGAALKVAGNIIAHPIDSAKAVIKTAPEVATGFAEGVVNAVPYYDPEKGLRIGDLGNQLEKQAFMTGLQQSGGMSQESANSLWDAYMDPAKSDARGVGSFLSFFIPYEAAENATAQGLRWAAPKFVQNHELAAKIITKVVGAIGAGQATVGPEATGKQRLEQAGLDTLFVGAFESLGPAWRGAKKAIFRSAEKTALGEAGAIVEPHLGGEGDISIKKPSERPTATVVSPKGDLAVSTNNVEALQGYLKDSGKTNIVIEPKAQGSLGITREGLEVTARHSYNPTTNTHTMYVTNVADAQTIAHEWGHYINDEVAKQVRGLTTYLFDDATKVTKPQAIEDTIRSMATKELADQGSTIITNEMMDRKMSQIVSEIRSDVRQISKARPGADLRNLSGARGLSEKFSDAVAVALTDSSSYRKSTLYKFLEESKVTDQNLVKTLKGMDKGAKIVEDTANKTPLEIAKARQDAALTEKLGLGDTAPERPKRPGDTKFEKTKTQKEETTFQKVPEKTVARTETDVNNMIKKNKIPPKNLVEISAKGKQPVTLVVHELDRDIVRAVQLGADSKYIDYAVKRVMNEYGMSKKAAEEYVSKRFAELKAFAQSRAEEGQRVLAKAIRTPKGSEEAAIKAGEAEAAKTTPSEGGKGNEAPAKTAGQSIADTSEAQQQATYHTLAEMELAKPGERQMIGTGAQREVKGIPSTFPKWVPEELRSRGLFDIVSKHIEDGTEPAAKNVKQVRLYNIVKDMIEKRTNDYELNNLGEFEHIKAQSEARIAEEQALAEAEYAKSFGGVAASEGEGATKLNLDRMETGKVPASEPFRAEKMTEYQDEEVFLNTKVLPEMKGTERISRSNEDIIRQATASDMTEEKFLNILKERVGALTPDTRKGFEIAMDKAKRLQDMLGSRTAADLTVEELSAFKQELAQTTQLFEVYSGIRTEASNLLRSFGISMSRGEDDVLRGIFENLQKAGVANEKDVWRAMGKTYEEMNKSTIFNEYMKGLYASWLSGPATSLRNIFGNIGNIMSEIASKAANPKTIRELPDVLSNLYKDFSEKGLADAREILQGEKAVGNKFTSVYDPSFPLPKDAFDGTKKGLYDRLTESVGRFLNAQDIAFSRTVQEMESRAVKIYSPEISAEVSKAISDMYGLSTVYRGLPKGRMLRGLVMGTETATREAPMLKIFVPFVRTIGNVLDRQFDYLPIFSQLRLREAPLLEQARIIAKKYSISEEKDIQLIMGRLRDQQMGRMYLGTALTAASTVMATQGLISGNGPSNYNERLQLERTGWRRNSIKIGSTWVPYTFIGPLAGIFSLAGNIHDSIEYENASNKDVVAMIGNGLGGWAQTQLNMSFLKGTADLVDAVSSGQFKKYLTNLGAGLVPIPAAYTQSLNITKNIYSYAVNDPTLRQQVETSSIVDAIRSKLGLTGNAFGLKALNKKNDMFGAPLTLDIIYGITPTQDKMDKMPVDSFLINNGVVVTIPPKGQKFMIRGKEKTLTADEYEEYVKTSGQMIYTDLQRQLPALKRLKADQLQKRVQDIVSQDRERARNQLLH